MKNNIIHHYFTFNGKKSIDYGVQISGTETYNSPHREFKEYSVPGKNGTLIQDLGRYANIQVSFPAFISADFPKRAEAFRNAMCQDPFYHRLESTYHPDEFRLASYTGPFEASAFQNESGEFTVTFNCKPERWLKSGESPVLITNAGQSLFNPTSFPADPLITVHGLCRISINGEVIEVTDGSGMIVDCSIKEAYSEAEHLNRNGNLVLITGDFPKLNPGNNVITVEPTGESLKEIEVLITPRWYRL